MNLFACMSYSQETTLGSFFIVIYDYAMQLGLFYRYQALDLYFLSIIARAISDGFTIKHFTCPSNVVDVNFHAMVITFTSLNTSEMLFSLLCFSLLAFLINAAPVPQTPDTHQTLHWAATPGSRGTLTILFSCAAALAFCVWTGVHLNVHQSSSSKKKRRAREIETEVSKFLCKLLWALIALPLPDIVLTLALHQLLVALEYQRAVNEFIGRQSPLSVSELLQQLWSKVRRKKEGVRDKTQDMTLKMAFFATMGGFFYYDRSIEGQGRGVVGVDSLRELGVMSLIYGYPLPEVRDKSKASGIAKTVAIVQTGWVLLQCLGRYLEGLHITLLELNTAVHVVFAIVMYGIWWEKPFDVGNSVFIDAYGLGSNSVAAEEGEQSRHNLEDAVTYWLITSGNTQNPLKKAVARRAMITTAKRAAKRAASPR